MLGPSSTKITAASSTSSATTLLTPVQYLKGVGPQKADLLTKLQVKTVEDLLFHLPRTHQNRTLTKIREAKVGDKRSFEGVISDVAYQQVGKMLGQFRATVKDASGAFTAIWFKHLSFKYDVFATLKKYCVPGQFIRIFGEVEISKFGPSVKVEDFDFSLEAVSNPSQWVPVYPLTEGLNDRWMRLTLQLALQQTVNQLSDPLPESLRSKQNLLTLPSALQEFHQPQNKLMLDKARERLVFDEFFYLEVALAMNRQNREQTRKGISSVPTKKYLAPFKKRLKFEFTKAQIRVINEIFRDMARPQPMNRLLQGDVGSGKTIVALSAALLSIENGLQVALLAPTEILAEQHYFSICELLKGLDLDISLLTGSGLKKSKNKVLEGVSSGKIQLVIGTHALLSDTVKFKNLGLVIIDEQHRFGVRQRSVLIKKTVSSADSKEADLVESYHPDVLCMTATPIPRTLAMTLYGDLEVSTLDEKPAGRIPIKTSLVYENQSFKSMLNVIHQGQQIYLVYPVIEESEKKKAQSESLRAVVKEYEKLKLQFPDIKFGLLHGRMNSEEKKNVMDQFRSQLIHVLVATPVIEVGIDVPNASMISIYNPERFGLAALHQLRGRVGRGQSVSSCFLIASSEESFQNSRLQIFCSIEDGFKLAEEDLRMRGPGEILGESQHGLPFFKVANIVDDSLMLARAREAAHQLVHGDIPLTMKEFSQLSRELKKRFGQKLDLSRIG